MYKILGGDRQEYGPVSAEHVRQWIAEGRANAGTLVQPEGSSAWVPLGSLPEFSLAASQAPPPLLDDRKSKLVAGLLGILLGGLGVHRFYLGHIGIGLLQILVTVVTCGWGWLWGFIEGILILTGSTITTDAEGKPLKD
ncbi:MAG: NINE protein [Verrucomicrobia bacterium]|nr:NINE protein [Verrucomicrobiota bacterium]